MDDADNVMETFIQRHLPQCVEKVERIQGGVLNYTFRLYLKSELPPISINTLDQHSLIALIYQLKLTSCIAKLAFPYIAAFGNSMPYPLCRQQIEEKALKLFDDSLLHPGSNQLMLNGVLSALHRNSPIKIARVLFRDEINNVLIMEDLGSLLTIEQWLTSEDKSLPTESTLVQTQAYGEQLGTFIADMHIFSLPLINELYPLLRNLDYEEILRTKFYPCMQGMLNAYNVSDANELALLAVQYRDYNASQAAMCDKVFVHGDLWTPQILINTLNRTLGIIDWELACVDSPVQDLARLSSCCHLLTLIYPSNEHILKFMHSFMDAYRKTAMKNKVDWYQSEHKKYLFAWSLGVRHAIYLFQLLLSKEYCFCHQETCCHKHSIIVLAADYLRRCRSGPEKATYDLMSRDQILGRLL